MSQENVEVVRRRLDAWSRRDLDAVLSDVSPDFQLIPLPGLPVSGPFHGHAGARAFWNLPFEAFEQIRIEPAEGFIDAGAMG